MSGNVPPPPPPPEPAPRSSGDELPPSIAPGAAGAPGAPHDSTAATHEPVPPAPASPAPAPAGPAPAAQPYYPQRQPVYTQPQQPVPPQYGYTPQQYAYQQPTTPPGGTPPPGTPNAAAGAGKGGRRRKKLSPGLIAFVVVDVVLIGVAAVFIFNGLTGSDLPSVDARDEPAPAVSQSAGDPDGDAQEDEDPAADRGAQVAEFASPSLNISCEIFENGVSCGIAELSQQPAPVEGCDGSTGYVATLDDEGKVALPCVAKSDQPKKASGDLEELAYGDSRTEGDYTCTSEQDGMYCQYDPSGKGFSLARAGVGTF